jgi:hypothetical protein
MVQNLHHGAPHPSVADGRDGLQIYRVDAKMLNKKSPRAERDLYSIVWVERRAKNFSPLKRNQKVIKCDRKIFKIGTAALQ